MRSSKAKPNYPDTSAGAIDYLKADSSLNLAGAKAQADPSVAGVWKVTTPNDPNVEFAIVYLAGYPDPFGVTRPLDDFETVSREVEEIEGVTIPPYCPFTLPFPQGDLDKEDETGPERIDD